MKCTCRRCGVEVEAHEGGAFVEYRDDSAEFGLRGAVEVVVSLDRHDAPCGLPCYGGGVSPRVYRTGQVHGSRDACPRCGPLEEAPHE